MAASIVSDPPVLTRNLLDFATKHCDIKGNELGGLSHHLRKSGIKLGIDVTLAEFITGTNDDLWGIKLMIDQYLSRERKIHTLTTNLA
ncbi:MAG: hypothetical protein Harvfovirus25_1, partial [Harvfovirus sp.]